MSTSRRLVFALLAIAPLVAAKRPLNQDDYDGWNHIQNQTLSDDGRYLAYALFPQQGDGSLVIRDLKTGKETRQSIGELPPPPPPNYSSPQVEEMPPPPPGIAVKFTQDGRYTVFSTFPTHAAVEQAKRAKVKPEDMPKGDLVIIRLDSNQVFRAPGVKDFQLPREASTVVAYLQLPAKAPEPKTPSPEADPAAPKKKKLEVGDLVLRDLENGAERRFSRVSGYSLTKNAQTLVFTTASESGESNGVYVVSPASDSGPAALLSGKGVFDKLAWDEDETRLAFLSNTGAPKKDNPDEYRLYTWDRHSPSAVALVSPETPGLPAGWVLSSKATVAIAKGGNRIFFGTNPKPPELPKIDPSVPSDERVSVDLWSWKDDYIQPMQKIRAATERSRSYRAVFDLADNRFTQLADPTMNDLLPSEDGQYAIGNDDRLYRRIQEYDAPYVDSYLVNVSTGERKRVAPKHIGRVAWSPDSQYAVFFDGKDWISLSATQARAINLTAKLGVSFGNEQNDTPGFAESYRLAGWTKDGRYVLLYDRYDIWRCAPDGNSAENLTRQAGRQAKIAFRLVRFESDDPASRWLDPAQPLLLRAESEETHDSGFYRTTLDASAAPVKLVYAAKNFAPPVKAKNAEVYVTAASTFSQYPDLLVADRDFRELNKVSNANPQMANLLWGSAELVRFNSADGLPLKAILYKPANFDPAKKYPLLVYIYERLTQNVHLFVEPRPYNSINPSLYASNGYLVLEPDIAYRIGYPGQSALDCVLPAIQAVVDQGFVNEKAIGIQGHSWGGYQIAYMITRTNRFRAASAGAPVADMISAYDGIRWGPGMPRQFQYERTQSRIGGSVWEYPLRYIENSPIFMADRVNTPLLMIHNDADDAVPWYQGIEYYLALRRLDKEVYLFSYNGEPHNLRRRVNQKDYALRLQQFFDYYLKGSPEPDWLEHGIPYLEKPGAATALDTP